MIVAGIEKQTHQQGLRKGVRLLARNSLFGAVAFAALETIWPILLFSFFQNESVVGYVSAGFAILNIIGLATLYPLFHKYHPKDLFYASMILQALIFIAYTQVTDAYLFLLLATLSVVCSSIRLQAYGILLRENSSRKTIAKNEGLVYFLANIGWLVAPLVAGFLADIFSMQVVLVMSSVFLLVGVYDFTLSRGLREAKVRQTPKPFFVNFRTYFHSRRRIKSYILSAGVQFWYVLPYIFLPLHMKKAGLGFDMIGIFLFAFALPLVVMQYWIKNQNKVPMHRLMQYGYALVTAGLLAAAILSDNIYVQLACVVLAAFGSGLLEPTVDSYFFAITNMKEERDYYGTFMTSKLVGGFASRIIVSSILLVAPLAIGISVVATAIFGHFLLAMTIRK